MLKLEPDTHSENVFLVKRKNGTSYLCTDKKNLFDYVKNCRTIDECQIQEILELCTFNVTWNIKQKD